MMRIVVESLPQDRRMTLSPVFSFCKGFSIKMSEDGGGLSERYID